MHKNWNSIHLLLFYLKKKRTPGFVWKICKTSKIYILQYILIKVWRSVYICSEDFLKKKAGILVGISIDDSEYEPLKNCLKFISKKRDMVSNNFSIKHYHICFFKNHYYIIFFIYKFIHTTSHQSECSSINKHNYVSQSDSSFNKKF